MFHTSDVSVVKGHQYGMWLATNGEFNANAVGKATYTNLKMMRGEIGVRRMMTNYEHYKDWFDENKFMLFTRYAFAVDKESNEPAFCISIPCRDCLFEKLCCHTERLEWLNAEYEEPPVDWSKVPVDAKIEVKCDGYGYWTRRQFAKYVNGKVIAWDGGRTSYTAAGDNDTSSWDCARLYKEEAEVKII